MPSIPASASAYFLEVPPGVLSAADAEAATYQLAAHTSSGSAERTDEHQAALFDILHRVANSTVDAGGGMAQRVVETLSFVVGDEADQATMAQAGAVLDQLVLSQASSLVAAGGSGDAQSIITTSANIQMLVAVTPPGDSLLTTQPLTVPGCASAFEPMPANLLPTDVGIITSFFALAFDPHAGTSGVNTTGVTRLAFSYTDGTPLEVGNATTPIRFTLPGVDTSGGEQASCSFWDTVAEAYSTDGCVGLPAPYPPGHNVTWLDNFTAHSDADLVLSWELSGPMVDDGSCYAAVLDCTSEQPGPYFVDPRTRELQLSIHPATVYPDPWEPLVESAVSCGNGSTGPLRTLRVYYGHDCQLWQADNDYNCSWSNVKQAFEGGGCVSNGPTKCMCRHLTDFASARVPKIATCSLSDMTSLSPNDLLTKLKFLFQLVVILFGVMNLGAVAGVWMDMNQRKSALAAFQRPEMGFTEHPGGELWTWRCAQESLDRAVGAPAGTAVQMAHAMGVPFARLRAAVPEALVAGSVGHALGRRGGLSVTGLTAAHEENMAAMTSLRNSFSCFGGGGREKIPEFGAEPMTNAQAQKGGAPERIPAFSDSAERKALAPVKTGRSRGAGMLKATEPSAAPAESSSGGRDEVAEEMVGTALVLAFMSNAKTLKVTEQARRVAAASAHFRGITVRGFDHDWDWLYSCYLLMLNPGNLSSRSGWLEKSRLWRFLMMQREDGSWNADNSIAFALQSHDARPDAPPPPKTQNRFLLLLGSLLGGDDDVEEMFEDAEEDAEAEARAARRSSVQPPPLVTATGEPLPSDCPLTFSHAAIIASMPPLLATLNFGFYRRQAEQARQAELLAQQEAELEAARRAAAGSLPTSPTGTEMDAAGFGASARLAALLQVGTAQSLRSLLDGAVESLQREMGAMQRQVSTAQRASEAAPQRMRRTEEMRSLQRATSRRLERMVSLRLALPPDPTPTPQSEPEPARPAATESGASQRPGPRGRDRRGPVPIERIWATVLSVETLRELHCCWLIDDEAEVARTIVDAGYDFLHAQARADPRVRRMLKSGSLLSAARRARREWGALQRSAVGQLRDADIINKFTALTHVQRASARIVRSMCTDHTTFATFLDVDGYIMRWQRFMILMTLVCSTLLVSIWFYYSRGATCCAEMRAILECDPVGPCRGFAGDCGDFQTQFADVQGPYMYAVGPNGKPTPHMYLDQYVCQAFPDDAYITDQFFVGLISIAVALPIDLFLVSAFETTNAVDIPCNWLEAPAGRWRFLLGKSAHNGWRFTEARKPVSELTHWVVSGGAPTMLQQLIFVLGYLLGRARAIVFGEPKPPKADTAEEDADAASEAGSAAARADALTKRMYASAGLLGVYATWAVFSWVIFTYGMLIYTLLGKDAEQEFTRTWGVGCAMNNCSEWQEVFKTAAKAALLIVILDALRVTRNSDWFEEHVDFVSMQAVLFNGAARGWWAQTQALVRMQARLTEDE